MAFFCPGAAHGSARKKSLGLFIHNTALSLSLSDLNFYNSTILPPFPCPLGHLYSPYLSLCFTSSFLSLNKFFNTA